MKIEVWGDFASFNRPEFRVERYSYDFITPSAARSIMDAIYWHPSFVWVIDKIYIMNPIKRMKLKRNELKNMGSYTEMKKYAFGKQNAPHLKIDQTPRNSVVLKDVRYVIEAHFEPSGKEGFDENKIHAIAMERARKGQCFKTPYLGCREFSADFRLVENKEKVYPAELNYRAGVMLYDLDYSKERPEPYFFDAVVRNGIVDLRECEVYKRCC